MTTCINPAHAAVPADGCTGCMHDINAELTALNDRYMRLLGERNGWERAVRAAAARSEHDHAVAFAHLILPKLLRDAVPDVTRALGMTTMIDPAWGRTREAREHLADLLHAGTRGFRSFHEATGMEAATAAQAADPARAEIERLRALITKTGQRLHSEARDANGRCHCDGCELVRAMDDPAPPADPGGEDDDGPYLITMNADPPHPPYRLPERETGGAT